LSAKKVACAQGQRFNPQTNACQPFTLHSSNRNNGGGGGGGGSIKKLSAKFTRDKAPVSDTETPEPVEDSSSSDDNNNNNNTNHA
jgi:hypothetical protein